MSMMRLRMSNRTTYDEANQNIESAIKVNDIEFVPTVSGYVWKYGTMYNTYGASQIAGDNHYKDE